MDPTQVALRHYRSSARLVQLTVRQLRALWDQVDPDRIAGSWAFLRPGAVRTLTGAQAAGARLADPYLGTVLAAQDINPATDHLIQPSGFAGVASDGRPLDSLLIAPVAQTLTQIRSGQPVSEAQRSGRTLLDTIVATLIADAARTAVGAGLTARRHAGGYVRQIVGASCSRCVILAGRWYGWNAGFQRHPQCDCIHVPTSRANDLRSNPREYFNSLSPAEQNRVFGRAGADAIRDGADIAQVVNARRGMGTASVAGQQVRITAEGGGRLRLMPEQISALAGTDRDEAIRLLRIHGYLT